MSTTKPERGTPHHDELNRLRRIEGQVRGLQRMVEEDRYCIDILTQIRSARAALGRVSDSILRRHLHHCVAHALTSGNSTERDEKLQEVFSAIEKARH